MKKEISFLGHSKPLLTAMVQAKTPEEACCIITDSMYDGAEAFGIQLENLERKYRNVETLKSIFYHCGDKPIYITSYRNGESTGYTDEECEQYLLMGLEAGAALCDVMGDMYKQEKYGITYDEEAVKKQRELIDKIHSRGGEVLMKIDRVGKDCTRAQGVCGSLSGSVPTNVGQPTIRVSSLTVGGK